MRLLTADEMRLADQAAINDFGIPGIVLMENAGLAVVAQVEALLGGDLNGKKAAVFCGGGNNGGDGLVVARHLHNKGCEVRLYFLSDPDIFRGDALTNYEILCNMGVSGLQLSESRRLNVARMALWSSDVAIDAIFGTGLHDDVQGINLEVIQMLNESNTPVVSCDIPSGLSSVSGKPLGDAVKADTTVTFGYCKLGLVLSQARPYVGKLVVADISLPEQVEESIPVRRELLDETFCRRWLETRDPEAHKGDFGHVAVLAGSPAMPGAAILACRSAMRTGAGKVTAAVPEAARLPLLSQLPEVMLMDGAAEADGSFSVADLPRLTEFPADAWLIGPGLGRSDQAMELVRELLLNLTVPTVLDADALFAVCGNLGLLKKAGAPLVITPHPGEMARLLGVPVADVQANRVAVAEVLARRTNVIVVLKGAGTVVATPEGRIFINDTGNPGMATGGAGDVLAGMIAAFLAQGMVPACAAACAVWLHGRAGDLAADGIGQAGVLAGDIVEHIPAALKSIDR
ncbi:MAG: NAD(P)H-hydrate dehydratase [Firmicutes bacterium]|nr:NAD(P)H-hydrate dehydratase [Bacillota bacterium]